MKTKTEMEGGHSTWADAASRRRSSHEKDVRKAFTNAGFAIEIVLPRSVRALINLRNKKPAASSKKRSSFEMDTKPASTEVFLSELLRSQISPAKLCESVKTDIKGSSVEQSFFSGLYSQVETGLGAHTLLLPARPLGR